MWCVPNAAARLVSAGMDAHQAGTSVGRAIAASIGGNIVGSLFGNVAGAAATTALNGGNRREILGAAASGFIGGLFGASDNAVVQAIGIPVAGCIGALVSGGSCGRGAADAVIGAGIDAAGTAAWRYVQSEFADKMQMGAKPTHNEKGEQLNNRRAFKAGLSNFVIRGGTSQDAQDVEREAKEIFSTARGQEVLQALSERRVFFFIKITYTIDLNVVNDAYVKMFPLTSIPLDNTIYLDSRYSPILAYEKGDFPASHQSMLAHEFGHLIGLDDDGPERMNNVRLTENPIMRQLGRLPHGNRIMYPPPDKQ